MKRHLLIGGGAGLLLVLVYLGIVTLAQGLEHAWEQTARVWYWVAALAGGFGVQAGLFSFLRKGLRQGRGVATASVAASGGLSTGSMVACCAHHLSDVLPLLGFSGLAAFLVNYQLLFLIAGLLSNLVGITIMLEAIQRHGLSRRLAGWNMGRVKKATMISAALILVAAFFHNFLKPQGVL